MFVCVCKAVSDKRIRQLVAEGATNLRAVSRATGLGTCCGVCVPQAREVVDQALMSQPIRLADLSPAQMGSVAA